MIFIVFSFTARFGVAEISKKNLFFIVFQSLINCLTIRPNLSMLRSPSYLKQM